VPILVSGPVAELPGIHLNFLLVFVAAAAVTTVAGALIGVPTLRLRGDYIAIVTVAFGAIIVLVMLLRPEGLVIRRRSRNGGGYG
jgi:branched-chain amino acid transport system permease protein